MTMKLKMKTKLSTKKRVLCLCFVFALICSLLSSCAFGSKTMSEEDRAEADSVFETTDNSQAKKELFEAFKDWFEKAQKEDGYALLPNENGEEAKVFVKVEEEKVFLKLEGELSQSIVDADKGELNLTLKGITLSGSVIDSSAKDNISYIPQDVITGAEGVATIVLSDGKTYEIPYTVKEIALGANTVRATKLSTSDKDFGNAKADEIDSAITLIKSAIEKLTPALNSSVVIYDPYADAIEYIDKTSNDSFTITQVLRIPIGWILEFSFKLVKNYTLALLLFAIVTKLLLFPFGIMQQKSTIKQAKFAPKQKAIMKKYEGRTDQATKQKMQQEIMDAQQKEGVNMFGGCLPLLIQFPVLIALFNVIRNPLRYMCQIPASVISKLQVRTAALYAKGFTFSDELLSSRYGALKTIAENVDSIAATSRGELASTIASKTSSVDTLNLIPNIRNYFDSFVDLLKDTKVTTIDALPDFHIFGNFGDLSVKPAFWNWMLIIPVLTFIIVFVTSKLTKKLTYQPPTQNGADMGASMKIMDWIMPLFSAYIAFVWPAIMGLYWIYQNILGVLQQLVLKKMFPLPVFTEEDYKKAEIEVLGKNPKKPKYVPNNANAGTKRNPKSLHHIDDDDDGDGDGGEIASGSGANPPAKKNSLIEGAALKDAPTRYDRDDENDENASGNDAVATLNGEKLEGDYTKRKRGKKSHRVSSVPVSENENEENAESKEDSEEE